MIRAAALAVVLTACGSRRPVAPVTHVPPPPGLAAESFVAYGGSSGSSGGVEDVAVLPGGDLVLVGCEYGAIDFDPDAPATRTSARMGHGEWSIFVTRLDRSTRTAVWTRRSSSPCSLKDNWTVPRVAVTSRGTIWVAAFGWGRGPYDEETAQTALLAFDADGGLGAQRELGPGIRVRAMAALPGDRIAITGQSATEHTRATAFVAAIDGEGADVWRTAVPEPHLVLVTSLAVDGDHLLVGGSVPGTIEVVDDVARGREEVGFVTTLHAGTGQIMGTAQRAYPGVNVSDVHVAVAGGTAYVAYELGLRRGNPWPRELPAHPSPGFGAILVEPFAAQPAWRRLVAGATHASVEDLAATPDRLALAVTLQGGTIDLGGGPWTVQHFSVGGHVEISTATGSIAHARRLAAAGDGRVFFRRVVWEGGAFTVVGEAEGKVDTERISKSLEFEAPVVWRIGADAR